MTLSILQVTGGALILGLAISYAWWCRVRVIYLRQDLFKVRDELWLATKRMGMLDDPAYREARDLFNSCIRGASFISLPQFINGLIDSRMRNVQIEETKTENHELQAAIDDAHRQLVERLSKYVLRDRFVSGIVLAIVATVALGSAVKFIRFLQMVIDSWRKTQGPKILSSTEIGLHSAAP